MAEDGSDVIALRSEPTRADQGADAVVDRIVRMIDTVIAETIAQTGAKRDDMIGVGVGAPGPLDRERGIVVTTPNLGWTNFPLRDVIAERVQRSGKDTIQRGVGQVISAMTRVIEKGALWNAVYADMRDVQGLGYRQPTPAAAIADLGKRYRRVRELLLEAVRAARQDTRPRRKT